MWRSTKEEGFFLIKEDKKKGRRGESVVSRSLWVQGRVRVWKGRSLGSVDFGVRVVLTRQGSSFSQSYHHRLIQAPVLFTGQISQKTRYNSVEVSLLSSFNSIASAYRPRPSHHSFIPEASIFFPGSAKSEFLIDPA